MLRLLRRILGWDANSGPFDFDGLEELRRTPPRTGPALNQQREPAPQASAPQATTSVVKEKPTPPRREKTAEEILNNPELSLNATQEEGFDPYNTGAFNRSASWEKIAKNRATR